MLSHAVVLPEASSHSEIALPPAQEVLRRIVERGRRGADSADSPNYAYDKRALEEELDGKDRITETTVKLYRVRVIEGKPVPRLIKIEGRNLSHAELDEENKREGTFRQKPESVDPKGRDSEQSRSVFSESELEKRFVFRIVRREIIEGRPAIVMTFTPKVFKVGKQDIRDKILRNISGTLWVDEQEADIVRLKLNLGESVAFGWFGLAGSLQQFQLAVERARLADGIWVTQKTALLLRSRILFKTFHLRRTEHSSGFVRESSEAR